jgi:hypothetical protein
VGEIMSDGLGARTSAFFLHTIAEKEQKIRRQERHIRRLRALCVARGANSFVDAGEHLPDHDGIVEVLTTGYMNNRGRRHETDEMRLGCHPYGRISLLCP